MTNYNELTNNLEILKLEKMKEILLSKVFQ